MRRKMEYNTVLKMLVNIGANSIYAAGGSKYEEGIDRNRVA